MNKPQDIAKRVEETLNSLEGIQRAEPNPFFYTRLRARMGRTEKGLFEKIGALLARPIIASAGLGLVLSLNVFALLGKGAEESPAVISSQVVQLPVEEYTLTASSSNYEFENFEP